MFHTVRIEGTSMVDTLRGGDLALVTRFDYRIGAPERGDIVECSFPGRSGTYIKRVIGLPGDTVETPIWDEFGKIVEKYEPGTKLGFIERFKFYDEAKKAYAVVSTSEKALYANVILQKGVIK